LKTNEKGKKKVRREKRRCLDGFPKYIFNEQCNEALVWKFSKTFFTTG
jgi:hypothetical protein